MYKLLSPDEKKKVEGEYRRRRLIVYMNVFSFALLLGVIALFPTYATLWAKREAASQTLNILRSATATTTTEAGLKNWAGEINKELILLDPATDNDKPYEYISKAIEAKQSGISLTSFSWRKVSSAPVLTVSGTASTRQALLQFEKSLNTSPSFKQTSFPISELAEDKDIPFQYDLNPILPK